MIGWAIYGMVYVGAALMVNNIYCFVQFARFIRERKVRGVQDKLLYLPIILLVLFLAGYLAVGIFGEPDLVVAGILFGGSVFVYIIYKFIDNITQRIMESEHLEAELMAAEESSAAKTAFLSSVSHEMRTPMNVILGLSSIAMKNPDLQPDTREQLKKINRSGKHLLGLINNVLDTNSMESGELTVKEEEFDLRDMWNQVNAIAGTQCEEKGLAYHTTLDEFSEGRYVGDSMLLKQALLAVLDNAVKYTDAPGTVELSIGRVDHCDAVCKVACRVSDTGVGISPEHLEQIFEVFGQEDSSSTNKHGGSGLGLPTAKRKVELMGGTIEVESQKHVGSTFVITVPLDCAACCAKDEAEAPQDPEPAENTLEGARVLIVEDVAENAEIVADLLELEDAITEHAENGQVALDMFRESEPGYYDAVLMDLRMPVMDGLEATRQIRASAHPDAQAVPIIALTANALESDVRHCMEVGMNAHMPKPTDANQLYTTLADHIRDRRNREAKTDHD